MKKKNIKNLKLNKRFISNLNTEKGAIVGGTGTFVSASCPGNGICAQTDNCPTDGCGSATMNVCDTADCPTNGCFTVSCPGVGICG